MMNHFVPEFDTDDDFVNLSSSSSMKQLPRKPIMGGEEDEELLELLWHNGHVVLHNQRPDIPTTKKPSSSVKLQAPPPPPPPPLHQQPLDDQNLFIHEDEMTSWLHYPHDDDFCSDLLFSASTAPPPAPCPASTSTLTQVTASIPPAPSPARPPAPSPERPPAPTPRPPVRNFMNFSMLRGNFNGGNGRGESGPSIAKAIVRESTQVNPSTTPSSAASESGLTRRTDNIDSRVTAVNHGSSAAVASGSGLNWKGKAVASEIPGASSSVMSKSEIEPVHAQAEETPEKTAVDERKRKEREAIDETECRSEETKQGGGRGSSTKRSRAAQVHNLSERKRRDRINERMKALQELIPRCNKSDKASMLDEAIEYMKSLQLQIQMMSMGCGMMPMMYAGVQQYMPHMSMGMMGLGMNRPPPPPPPFMPFPNMLASQRPMPPQTHMGGYPLPNQQFDPTSAQPQYPGYMDPYQQFRNLQTTQAPHFQNQETPYPSSSRVSSNKEPDDHTTGG